MPDIPDELLCSEHVDFLPLPGSHDQLPAVLAGCDVLFLPGHFDTAYQNAIQLSLSSKAHLYMMSGRPILVYGPIWSENPSITPNSSVGVS